MATRQGTISLETTDALGIPATTLYNITVDDSKTVAQLMTDAVSLQTVQTPLSQGAVGRMEVCIKIPASGGSAAGDIEKGGLFNFNDAVSTYATGFWIPDISPSVLNALGTIDLSNSSVAAFITFLTTAHTAITLVTKGVNLLTSLRDALISFRKHRKPLARKTKEV